MSRAATDGGRTQRIPLQRAVAVITPRSIAVRRSRTGLVAPLIEAAAALLAVWLIVALMERLPLWLLMALLLFVIIAGPAAMLGLVYQVAGSSFRMERAQSTARWQQGLLGLGLGTRELVPFGRIARIEVGGDFEAELASGDLQDVVRWEVRLVKDNGRVLEIAAVAAARPLAGEALARANALARAVAEMAGVAVREGLLPAWALAADDAGDEDAEDEDAEDEDPAPDRRIDAGETINR